MLIILIYMCLGVVCRVKLSKDQDHGVAYGRLVWRGKPQPYDRRIHSARKSQWSLVEAPNYAKYRGDETSHVDLVKTANDWFEEHGTWVNPPEEQSQ